MTSKCLRLFFQNKMGSDYDLERVIDDWILMGFLVGNDFIPHLPNLHINHDALPLLYKTYMSVLPSLGGKTRLVSCVFPQFLVLVSSFSLVFSVCFHFCWNQTFQFGFKCFKVFSLGLFDSIIIIVDCNMCSEVSSCLLCCNI